MFSISQQTENGFTQLVLQDEANGCSAAILPAHGAILHQFTIQQNGQPVNVIDGYQSAEEFETSLTGLGFKGCKLSPFACRLKNGSYTFAQQQYKINDFYLGAHALHGLLYKAPYIVLVQEVLPTHASISLLHQYKGADVGYPFAYDCIVTYTLQQESRLAVSTTIVNKSNGLMPIQDGWHPYFALGGSINNWQLEMQTKDMVVMNEEILPIGVLQHWEEYGSLRLIGDAQFDHCFTLNFAECQPLCVVRNPAEKIQVEIYPDKSYPYLQVYTPPHRQSIAIENLSAAPDAFNNGIGLLTLEAEASATFSTRYKITSLA